MNFTPTPMLATNGMALLAIYNIWGLVFIAVGLFALLSLILSLFRRTRKGSRTLAAVSIVTSLAPSAVLLLFSEDLFRYAHTEVAWFAVLSLLPVGMSLAAAYCSRRDLPEETNHDRA